MGNLKSILYRKLTNLTSIGTLKTNSLRISNEQQNCETFKEKKILLKDAHIIFKSGKNEDHDCFKVSGMT